jgi:redox-sensitive bicupin YhaK (pirin superfamily)
MAKGLTRRNAMQRLAAASIGLFSFPWLFANKDKGDDEGVNELLTEEAAQSAVKRQFPLGFQWDTQDPFLFCVHHEDHFPVGNEYMGPAKTHFKGRQLGDDFIIKDGFRMYHGKVVPGFPGHPHRGFETVTVVRKGIVDHADSLGAAGRYGNGDVQWMTAGKGVQHSEMFPLISDKEENPMELFQVWLNLPKKNKMVEPHFKMLWRESIPYLKFDNKKVLVELIAGKWNKDKAGAPPPNSWAADESNEVLIVNIKMEPNSQVTLPLSNATVNRSLYFYEGEELLINDVKLSKYHGAYLDGKVTTTLKTGNSVASVFILQGKPINEPVMQYGPFVMNTKEEIQQAFDDFHKTKFGGWPWPKYDQVHDRSRPRFAQHADGTSEVKAG